MVTDDIASLYPTCIACGEGITAEEIAALDWVSDGLIHGRNGYGCVPLYITQYIKKHPDTSIRDTMIVFGASRIAVMRYRRRAREDAE